MLRSPTGLADGLALFESARSGSIRTIRPRWGWVPRSDRVIPGWTRRISAGYQQNAAATAALPRNKARCNAVLRRGCAAQAGAAAWLTRLGRHRRVLSSRGAEKSSLFHLSPLSLDAKAQVRRLGGAPRARRRHRDRRGDDRRWRWRGEGAGRRAGTRGDRPRGAGSRGHRRPRLSRIRDEEHDARCRPRPDLRCRGGSARGVSLDRRRGRPQRGDLGRCR